MATPEWLAEELARRSEEDRLARKAAYDEWARNYADCGVRVDEEAGS